MQGVKLTYGLLHVFLWSYGTDTSLAFTLSIRCRDEAADNFTPAAVPPGLAPTAAAADNRGCTYSCEGLARHFRLPPGNATCFIDSGRHFHTALCNPFVIIHTK